MDNSEILSNVLEETDQSEAYRGSEEYSSRHTVITIHTPSNVMDAPPRSIPVGMSETGDTKHRPVRH